MSLSADGLRVPRADDAEVIAALFAASRSLNDATPLPAWPDGVSIRTVRSGEEREMQGRKSDGRLRLYESVGMRPVSRRVLYERRLSGTSAL